MFILQTGLTNDLGYSLPVQVIVSILVLLPILAFIVYYVLKLAGIIKPPSEMARLTARKRSAAQQEPKSICSPPETENPTTVVPTQSSPGLGVF